MRVELTRTREELQAKNEALEKLVCELREKQSDLSKIQKDFEEYKSSHVGVLQIF